MVTDIHLFAVISGIGCTNQILIRPSIQVRVFSTDKTIPSIASLTLAFIHWVAEVVDVDAFSKSVTVVSFIFARVLWFAHLYKKKDKKLQL